MRRSAYAVDVVLPTDLAELFEDFVTEPVPVRSTTLSLIAEGSAAATTAITFLQGPPAAAYWVGLVKGWLNRRRDSGLGEIRLKGPNGSAVFKVTAETDLAELAGVLHKHLFDRPRPARRDADDIAV
jgi:hypothetical protein